MGESTKVVSTDQTCYISVHMTKVQVPYRPTKLRLITRCLLYGTREREKFNLFKLNWSLPVDILLAAMS